MGLTEARSPYAYLYYSIILVLGFMLFYTGCEKQEDDLIRRMITGWITEQKRNYNSHPARKHR